MEVAAVTVSTVRSICCAMSCTSGLCLVLLLVVTVELLFVAIAVAIAPATVLAI